MDLEPCTTDAASAGIQQRADPLEDRRGVLVLASNVSNGAAGHQVCELHKPNEPRVASDYKRDLAGNDELRSAPEGFDAGGEKTAIQPFCPHSDDRPGPAPRRLLP